MREMLPYPVAIERIEEARKLLMMDPHNQTAPATLRTLVKHDHCEVAFKARCVLQHWRIPFCAPPRQQYQDMGASA